MLRTGILYRRATTECPNSWSSTLRSDQKLGDGAGWIPSNLSDASEEEQRDAAHRNIVSQGHHGVPQLMEQHAHKEYDGRYGTHEPIQRRRPVLELGGIVTSRQHPSE